MPPCEADTANRPSASVALSVVLKGLARTAQVRPPRSGPIGKFSADSFAAGKEAKKQS